jgi:large subunit ribosomal protein L9
MKVLLTKDVYKLGRAGEIKKVADGYGRNFLLPQGLAVLATAGALRQVEKIKAQAEIRRVNRTMSFKGWPIKSPGRAFLRRQRGDTGKLYGSSLPGWRLHCRKRRGLRSSANRSTCSPSANSANSLRTSALTMDLVPEIKVVVHRRGGT